MTKLFESCSFRGENYRSPYNGLHNHFSFPILPVQRHAFSPFFSSQSRLLSFPPGQVTDKLRRIKRAFAHTIARRRIRHEQRCQIYRVFLNSWVRKVIYRNPWDYRNYIGAKRCVLSLSFVWKCPNDDYLNFPQSYGQYKNKRDFTVF
jgi:hypothetical protein